jgi:alkyldihydroxyacetonephosphate synthase
VSEPQEGVARRGEPTPPIGLGGDPAGATTRFDVEQVAVTDAVLARLRSACADVRDDPADTAEPSRDWWPLAMTWALDNVLPGRAAVVARPASAAEVADVLRVCNEARVPLTPVAGRSGVCGASVPVFGGVALDLCGLAGIVDVDRESMVLDVLPGTFGDVLEEELRASHSVTLGHWPQSVALSTVGGWLACRSAGQYSNRYGKIEDMVVGLDVALADGTLVHTGGAPRSAVGPDLTQVFVGSEGTLGVITGARLRVHRVPEDRFAAAFGFPTFAAALDACRRIIQRGATPAVLRLYDTAESARNFEITDQHVLLVLDEADPAVLPGVETIVTAECAGVPSLDAELVDRWLGHRNDVSALQALTRHGIVVDTIEIAGRWAALPAIYDAATAAIMSVPGALVASAHQSHAYGDGACLYFTFAGRVDDEHDTGAKEAFYRGAWDGATNAVLAHGGALSHHHGVGMNRGRFMQDALGAGFDVLVGIKNALDPNGILNPGKLGLPSPFGTVPW